MLNRLEVLFRDVFDDPRMCINEQTSANTVPGWDSLTNIQLVFAVEREFKVKFALGEIQELNNVGDMISLIQKKQQCAA